MRRSVWCFKTSHKQTGKTHRSAHVWWPAGNLNLTHSHALQICLIGLSWKQETERDRKDPTIPTSDTLISLQINDILENKTWPKQGEIAENTMRPRASGGQSVQRICPTVCSASRSIFVWNMFSHALIITTSSWMSDGLNSLCGDVFMVSRLIDLRTADSGTLWWLPVQFGTKIAALDISNLRQKTSSTERPRFTSNDAIGRQRK